MLTLVPLFSPTAHAAQSGRAPLVIRNTFATAEAALLHFLERDASGAYWAGMLAPEMRALTTWTEGPQAETYFRYRDRTLGVTHQIAPDDVSIAVSWSGVTHRDAHGTRMPASENGKITQLFRLKRLQGEWKITEPAAQEFRPAIRTPRE
jgi:hypothetical protein